MVQPLLGHLRHEQRRLGDLLLRHQLPRVGDADVEVRPEDGVLAADLGAAQKVDGQRFPVVTLGEKFECTFILKSKIIYRDIRDIVQGYSIIRLNPDHINIRCEWEVGRLDVRGRLEHGGGSERGGAAGVDGGRHGRCQRRRLRRDEGAEVSAGVAERDGGARAEGGLPEQGQVDA